MDYHRIYDELIEKRKQDLPKGYVERHHILPKSLGGGDEPENLVSLTPEEHYLAHQLLVKMHPDNDSLVYAAQMMIPNRPSNKLYGWLKRRYSNACKKKCGPNNSQYGTRWICNIELQENKKISKDALIPDGWIAGRNKWKPKKKKIYSAKNCIKCNKEFRGSGSHCSNRCSQLGKKMSDETKRKLSKKLSNKPRPYRVGLKYNKTGCGQVW